MTHWFKNYSRESNIALNFTGLLMAGKKHPFRNQVKFPSGVTISTETALFATARGRKLQAPQINANVILDRGGSCEFVT